MNKENQHNGFILVPYDEFRDLRNKVDQLIALVKSDHKNPHEINGWIPEAEAMRMLNRKSTWFHHHGKDLLGGVRRGKSWWYPIKNINEYIENGKI